MSVTLKAKPYSPKGEGQASGLPLEYANFPFKFVHYPEGWEYIDGHGFLPSLSEISATPGVNGVGLDLKTNKADAGAAAKGGTILQPDSRALGPWMDYVVSYPVVNGNQHFCFKGTEFEPLPGGRYRPIDTRDTLTAFRTYLRDHHVVHSMTASVFNKLLEIAEKGYARLKRDKATEAELAAKAATIKAMKAAWAAGVTKSAPTPEAESAPTIALKPKSATSTIKAAAAPGETPHAG